MLPPLIAAGTRGRWYIARLSELPAGAEELPCAVCGGDYDVSDLATCPFHRGTICSLCCSTEGACHDRCKPNAWRPPAGATMLGMPAMPVLVARGGDDPAAVGAHAGGPAAVEEAQA